MFIERLIPLEANLKRKSVLLLGPRRIGKSALIRHQLKDYKLYNLLESDTFLRLSQRPSLIRESLGPSDRLIVIDEIQKLPNLMDEVHLMIEERGVRFLLTGSSARKLRRTHTSLMAGRAKTMGLFPFVTAELPDFDFARALQYGTLPPIYLSDDPEDELRSYVGDYLREEIQAEALSRNIESFSRFLHRAALSSGEVLNFESVARDAQVPARTIREYYTVLEDTLVGTMLEPFNTEGKRKSISKGKFYFFDVGVMNAIIGQYALAPATAAYGTAFEHFLFQEIHAYISYFGKNRKLRFWRSTTHQEVDFVVEDELAIEVKATSTCDVRDLRGLRAFSEEQSTRRKILVCQEKHKRTLDGVEIMPVQLFLKELWGNELLK